MTLSLQLDNGSLAAARAALIRTIEATRFPVNSAMTAVYYGVVMANFGSTGFDRPWGWKELSPAYAKRVGRTFATLYVTGALQDSVGVDVTETGGVVSMGAGNRGDVPYALAHHYGHPQKNLPARRVFPMRKDGSTTEATKALVLEAALRRLKEVL